MVSWSTIQSAVLFFGPILYPRLRSFYNTIQHPPHPPRPLPRTTYALLELLFVTGVLALLSSFPYFHPENIISRTNSRILHTSTDVIFTRLYNQRSPLPSDTILKSRLKSRTGRLLYSLYGPGPLINCTWCRVDAPETFFFYALPSILLPHLLHIAVLGVVTSARFLGGNNKAGAVWRTQATLAGLILAAIEIRYISTYSHTENISARTAAESVYPYWQLLANRGIAIAVVDGILGYAIYLTGTGRWGALLVDSPAESLEVISQKLENSLAGINSALCLKQAIMRDHSLRARTAQFWETEVLTGRELAQDEDVRVARRSVERRGDWAGVKGEAKKRARAVARGLFVKRPPMDEEGDGDDDDYDAGGWDSPKNSQEVKQESRSTTQQNTPVGSGYFEDESEVMGTQDEELEVEGMQYGSSSQQSSSMAGSFL